MRAAIALLFSTVAWAQVTGPTLGWVPFGSRVVPIYGLPGAARITDAPASAALGLIAVSPRQDYVLATSLATGETLRIVPGVSSTPIPGAAANPGRIVISPKGTAAALWFDSTSHFEIISGLPTTPSVLDLDATFLGAPPSAMAVSDDGQWLAASWPAGVYAWTSDTSVRQLDPDPGVVSLAFLAGQSNLALATSSRVFSIADVGGAAVKSNLYTAAFAHRTPHPLSTTPSSSSPMPAAQFIPSTSPPEPPLH